MRTVWPVKWPYCFNPKRYDTFFQALPIGYAECTRM